MKRHQKADKFLKGTYWNGEKGCAVGCGLHSMSAWSAAFDYYADQVLKILKGKERNKGCMNSGPPQFIVKPS